MRQPLAVARIGACVFVGALALATGGCGSSARSAAATETTAPTPYQVLTSGRPIGPPPNGETVEAASRRIAEKVAAADCGGMLRLYVLGSQSSRSAENCSTLTRIGAATGLSGARSYGGQAGVVESTAGQRAASLILVRQADGFFHIAFIAAHPPGAPVGTLSGRTADSAAESAVNAIHRQDCDGFLRVADPAAGIGSLPEPQACKALASDPVEAAMFASPTARPKRLGGDGSFAFYSLDTSASYLVVVLRRGAARGDQAAGPVQGPYRYVSSYVANASGV